MTVFFAHSLVNKRNRLVFDFFRQNGVQGRDGHNVPVQFNVFDFLGDFVQDRHWNDVAVDVLKVTIPMNNFFKVQVILKDESR